MQANDNILDFYIPNQYFSPFPPPPIHMWLLYLYIKKLYLQTHMVWP